MFCAVSASSTCETLEKEKNDLLIAYEGILQKVKDEHIAELSDLEEKLKQFYTGECEKLQTIFIEEAEKYKNELQEKVNFAWWMRDHRCQLFNTFCDLCCGNSLLFVLAIIVTKTESKGKSKTGLDNFWGLAI